MAGVLNSLRTCSKGGSAAEMALVTPLLLCMLFGPMELGNYFYSEHVVAKAVRDGARYASRRSFAEYSCSAPSNDVIDKTRNVTRTGQVASGGEMRLAGWSAANTITVSVTCDTSGTYTGIYTGLSGGVRIVTVSASVPYTSILGQMGLSSTSLTLNAQSQAAVMGV